MADRRLGSLVWEEAGDGAPVVMIHGLGGSSNSFQPLMAAMDGYRVIRPDLPGAGRSALQAGRPGIAGLAKAVLDICRAAGIDRARFVGHSMGTLVCQHLAISQPGLVAGMVLYGPITEPPPAARTALGERAETARRDGMAGIATAVAAGSVSQPSQTRNPVISAFVRESLMRQPPAGYAAHCEALAAWQAVDAGRIDCPVTLVAGQLDPVAPPAMASALAAAMRGAKVETLADVGHWMMMEAPQRSAEICRAHCDGA
jgi:pimeloyl-ACP methyl ester carboxylesterase